MCAPSLSHRIAQIGRDPEVRTLVIAPYRPDGRYGAPRCE